MKNKDILKSDNYKKHTLYEETIKKQRRFYRQWASKEQSLSVLEKLVNYQDGLAPTVIAEKLSIPKQTMTDILSSLESKKFITREIDNKDRRRIIIRITPSGFKYEEKMHAPLRKAQLLAFDKLSKTEKDKLVELTVKYTNELEIQLSKLNQNNDK